MKKFTTILAAGALMLAGLASCNKPGPAPQPEPPEPGPEPEPTKTWEEQVNEWLEASPFKGQVNLPSLSLDGLNVEVDTGKDQAGNDYVSFGVYDLVDTSAIVPAEEDEEGEEGEEAEEEEEPADYYEVCNALIRELMVKWHYDDEEFSDNWNGEFIVLSDYDEVGKYVKCDTIVEEPFNFLGFDFPGAVECTLTIEQALTPAETLEAFGEVAEAFGLEDLPLVSDPEDFGDVADWFRVEVPTYNILEDTIETVGQAAMDRENYWEIDDDGDYYTMFLYEAETAEEALKDVMDILIDEGFEYNSEDPQESIDKKGKPFTYVTMFEGKYHRVDVRIIAEEYKGDWLITVYALPQDPNAEVELPSGMMVKAFSKPAGAGVIPVADAFASAIDEDSWSLTTKYKGVGNVLETKLANEQGDTINGNFFEQYGNFRLGLWQDIESEAIETVTERINGDFAALGFEGTNLPDLSTVDQIMVKDYSSVDHLGETTWVIDSHDYYPSEGYDGDDHYTYGEVFMEMLKAQRIGNDPMWTEPEQRTSDSTKYWACYSTERITVGEGMDAKERRIGLQWLASNATFRLIAFIEDAPAAWDVESMNALTAAAGFETKVPSVAGEYFFNLDQYLQYGQFVVYAPDNDSSLLEAFAKQFVCEEPDEDPEEPELGALLHRGEEPAEGGEEPGEQPGEQPAAKAEWTDESFDYQGMWVYQFYSIEQTAVGANINPEIYGGNRISVQAYNQGGFSYFIVEIEGPEFNPCIGQYLEDSLDALGWGEADEMNTAFYWAEYLCDGGYMDYEIVKSQPYNALSGDPFIFSIAFESQYVDYVYEDIVGGDYAGYWEVDMFTGPFTGRQHNPNQGVYDYQFLLTDTGGEYLDAEGYIKYGYFEMICAPSSNFIQLIWVVYEPNQNELLDVEEINAGLTHYGVDIQLGDPEALGDIFSHKHFGEEYYNLTMVASERTYSSMEDVLAFLNALGEFFDVEGIIFDAEGFDPDTNTGTIYIVIQNDDGMLLYLEVTVVANTEQGEEEPSSWTVTVGGQWVHAPEAAEEEPAEPADPQAQD